MFCEDLVGGRATGIDPGADPIPEGPVPTSGGMRSDASKPKAVGVGDDLGCRCRACRKPCVPLAGVGRVLAEIALPRSIHRCRPYGVERNCATAPDSRVAVAGSSARTMSVSPAPSAGVPWAASIGGKYIRPMSSPTTYCESVAGIGSLSGKKSGPNHVAWRCIQQPGVKPSQLPSGGNIGSMARGGPSP